MWEPLTTAFFELCSNPTKNFFLADYNVTEAEFDDFLILVRKLKNLQNFETMKLFANNYYEDIYTINEALKPFLLHVINKNLEECMYIFEDELEKGYYDETIIQLIGSQCSNRYEHLHKSELVNRQTLSTFKRVFELLGEAYDKLYSSNLVASTRQRFWEESRKQYEKHSFSINKANQYIIGLTSDEKQIQAEIYNVLTERLAKYIASLPQQQQAGKGRVRKSGPKRNDHCAKVNSDYGHSWMSSTTIGLLGRLLVVGYQNPQWGTRRRFASLQKKPLGEAKVKPYEGSSLATHPGSF